MQDVARHAGVGVATVDRVLNRRAPVRAETAQRVFQAAETLGFHATPLLKKRIDDAGEERTLAFLLQKSSQSFYQALGHELGQATRGAASIRGRPIVTYVEDLTPAHVAARIDDLSARADALAIVAADHPKVAGAVERAAARGIPVFTLLSDLSTPARTAYIGIDQRKAGRTAAWAIARLARGPGSVAIFLGSHRYMGHELCEISFRSYLREHAGHLRLLEPLASFEDVHFAQEAARELVTRTPDLAGIYVAGGGIEGVIEALRETTRDPRVILVCNELVPETRTALIDGIADLVIANPLRELARATVDAMVAALRGRERPPNGSLLLPFTLFVPENV